MRELRIVFMGTPDFAVTILNHIVENNYNVVGVITAPDKPAGRGRKLNQSAVKKYAISKNLKVLQPTNLKDPDFVEELTSLQANLQVVVAFRMLPKIVWDLPKYGTFNLHASLLPDYRGAAPIHWAIINGETKTGVTTFFIDEKIDTGAMILKKEVVIGEHETVGQLHDRLAELGAVAVAETLEAIKNDEVTTTTQPPKDTKLAPKLFPDNCRINWTDPIHTIYNHIRGLNPFPAAWTELENENQVLSLKVYDVKKEETTHDFPVGSVHTTKKEIKVAVKNGFLILESLKISGKKKMDARSLLNGFTFSSDARML